jgi:hypothetical protein
MRGYVGGDLRVNRQGVRTRITPLSTFQTLVEHLAEGDLAAYGEITRALGEVPRAPAAGEVFLATGTQLVWYEALGSTADGLVCVRAYSKLLKTGEYDYVPPARLSVRVARWLFERARAHGFRTVRACN